MLNMSDINATEGSRKYLRARLYTAHSGLISIYFTRRREKCLHGLWPEGGLTRSYNILNILEPRYSYIKIFVSATGYNISFVITYIFLRFF